MHGSFVLFNPADVGAARASAWRFSRRRLVELIRAADGINPHPAVILVANPALNAQFFRAALHKPAEADSLDAPADPPLPGGLARLTHG